MNEKLLTNGSPEWAHGPLARAGCITSAICAHLKQIKSEVEDYADDEESFDDNDEFDVNMEDEDAADED